jgi:hypothetical protein
MKFARNKTGEKARRQAGCWTRRDEENDSDRTHEDRQRIFARVKGSVLRNIFPGDAACR